MIYNTSTSRILGTCYSCNAPIISVNLYTKPLCSLTTPHCTLGRLIFISLFSFTYFQMSHMKDHSVVCLSPSDGLNSVLYLFSSHLLLIAWSNLFLQWNYIPLHVKTSLFIHSSVFEHLYCFQILTIMIFTAVNRGVQESSKNNLLEPFGGDIKK